MKRSIINTAIAIATLTTLTVSANAEAKKGGKGRYKAPEAVFIKLDADQNAVLTLNELLANIESRAQKKLDRADTNISSEIELDEYLAKKRHSVDLSEFAADIVQCVQDTKDATEGSNIIVPAASHFASPQSKFTQLDTDNSGGISLTEITNTLTAHQTDAFSAMDENIDNSVTLEEFIQHGENRRATTEAVKACIDSLITLDEPV
ncbi:hypothetical protein PSECIP111854_03830 [Pseudoalteromonas sp. CIP111854]|uniref:EF-hand domain-containing protein n=1 Tax=Pseudoalteromonas holothuriae TaxID=2963714 RepID=A0A9W4R4H8_9GAMM|nr:EF-hand domain-containing protein [Pseudoalteromonas sp. CIP111854]CAH9066148.1 hypothetical protein PSECIP111854_03830 [Pseudoalteromonas sp. CIP111854]